MIKLFTGVSVNGNAVLVVKSSLRSPSPLEADEQISGLSADAEDQVVNFSFERIEGVTRTYRLSDFRFEGLSELIDLQGELFGSCWVSLLFVLLRQWRKPSFLAARRSQSDFRSSRRLSVAVAASASHPARTFRFLDPLIELLRRRFHRRG